MSPPRRAGAAERIGRGLALVVAIGCFGAIAWSARQEPSPPVRPGPSVDRPRPAAAAAARPNAPATTAEACRERKRVEIEALLAQGELTAERRMRIRQIEARPCE